MAALICISCSSGPDATKTEFSSDEQTVAAENLIKRVVGKKADAFKVSILPSEGKDWFSYSSDGKKILHIDDCTIILKENCSDGQEA